MIAHKEKAEMLIRSFHPLCGGMEPMQTENAKKCGALLVNELVMSQPARHINVAPGFVQYPVDYWRAVLVEIQNYETI